MHQLQTGPGMFVRQRKVPQVLAIQKGGGSLQVARRIQLTLNSTAAKSARPRIGSHTRLTANRRTSKKDIHPDGLSRIDCQILWQAPLWRQWAHFNTCGETLNVKDNEGEEAVLQQDIALLFAASGDLRNIVKTIAGLPEGYAGKCFVVVNDLNTAITARNTMLLLTTLRFEPEVAAPIMLHLWYSAILPQNVLEVLQIGILPYVKDVCRKVRSRPETSMQAKTFQVGSNTLRLILKEWEWDGLAAMFHVPEGLSTPKAQSIRRSITLARTDHIDRSVYKMSPGQRAGAMDMRRHGVLLPFGASRKDFSVPNP